jgi:hypothetical protein
MIDIAKARGLCGKASFHLTGNEIDEDLKILVDQAAMLPVLLDEIDGLEKVISAPVESFGTPELIAWCQELSRLLDVPENERGEIAFVLSVGCHLEKFAKSWNSPTMAAKDEHIAELEAETGLLRALSSDQHSMMLDMEAANQALKDALVEKQAQYMHHIMYGNGMFVMDAWKDRAREQLSREMPEIFGEGKA